MFYIDHEDPVSRGMLVVEDGKVGRPSEKEQENMGKWGSGTLVTSWESLEGLEKLGGSWGSESMRIVKLVVSLRLVILKDGYALCTKRSLGHSF